MLPHSSAYVNAVLRGEAERVEQAALGTRNHTLFRAAARLGSFVAQGLVAEDVVVRLLEHACRHHPDFGRREVARTIASGLRRAARNAPTSAAPRQTRHCPHACATDDCVIHMRTELSTDRAL